MTSPSPKVFWSSCTKRAAPANSILSWSMFLTVFGRNFPVACTAAKKLVARGNDNTHIIFLAFRSCAQMKLSSMTCSSMCCVNWYRPPPLAGRTASVGILMWKI